MRFFFCPVLLLAGVLASCRADPVTNDRAGNVQNVATQTNINDAPALPTISEPLSRRDLLLATAGAASDFAAGVDDAERQRELDGQPFSFAIRLCQGDTGGAMFRSSFDEESRVLRLEVRPDIEANSPVIQQLSGPGIEAVEGFWIRKPWLLDPACPAAAPAAPPFEQREAGEAAEQDAEATQGAAERRLEPPLPWVGIAEFHDQASDRSSRRGDRPYEMTRRLPEGARVGAVDLLIEGRLRALPAGKVIVCAGGSTATPPTCIISVRIDTVSLRQPGGEMLAEWSQS